MISIRERRAKRITSINQRRKEGEEREGGVTTNKTKKRKFWKVFFFFWKIFFLRPVARESRSTFTAAALEEKENF